MTPLERLVVLIDLIITIKAIEFQNFGKPGVHRYGFLEVCCRDSDQSGKITDFYIQVSQTARGCQMLENIEDSISRVLKE